MASKYYSSRGKFIGNSSSSSSSSTQSGSGGSSTTSGQFGGITKGEGDTRVVKYGDTTYTYRPGGGGVVYRTSPEGTVFYKQPEVSELTPELVKQLEQKTSTYYAVGGKAVSEEVFRQEQAKVLRQTEQRQKQREAEVYRQTFGEDQPILSESAQALAAIDIYKKAGMVGGIGATIRSSGFQLKLEQAQREALEQLEKERGYKQEFGMVPVTEGYTPPRYTTFKGGLDFGGREFDVDFTLMKGIQPKEIKTVEKVDTFKPKYVPTVEGFMEGYEPDIVKQEIKRLSDISQALSISGQKIKDIEEQKRIQRISRPSTIEPFTTRLEKPTFKGLVERYQTTQSALAGATTKLLIPDKLLSTMERARDKPYTPKEPKKVTFKLGDTTYRFKQSLVGDKKSYDIQSGIIDASLKTLKTVREKPVTTMGEYYLWKKGGQAASFVLGGVRLAASAKPIAKTGEVASKAAPKVWKIALKKGVKALPNVIVGGFVYKEIKDEPDLGSKIYRAEKIGFQFGAFGKGFKQAELGITEKIKFPKKYLGVFRDPYKTLKKTVSIEKLKSGKIGVREMFEVPTIQKEIISREPVKLRKKAFDYVSEASARVGGYEGAFARKGFKKLKLKIPTSKDQKIIEKVLKEKYITDQYPTYTRDIYYRRPRATEFPRLDLVEQPPRVEKILTFVKGYKKTITPKITKELYKFKYIKTRKNIPTVEFTPKGYTFGKEKIDTTKLRKVIISTLKGEGLPKTVYIDPYIKSKDVIKGSKVFEQTRELRLGEPPYISQVETMFPTSAPYEKQVGTFFKKRPKIVTIKPKKKMGEKALEGLTYTIQKEKTGFWGGVYKDQLPKARQQALKNLAKQRQKEALVTAREDLGIKPSKKGIVQETTKETKKKLKLDKRPISVTRVDVLKPQYVFTTTPIVTKPTPKTAISPTLDIKTSLGIKPILEDKPIISSKPIISIKPILSEKPIQEERPIYEEKPILEERPIYEERPVLVEQPVLIQRPLLVQRPITTQKIRYKYEPPREPPPIIIDDFDTTKKKKKKKFRGLLFRIPIFRPGSPTLIGRTLPKISKKEAAKIKKYPVTGIVPRPLIK